LGRPWGQAPSREVPDEVCLRSAAGDDREADVACPADSREAGRATSKVGTNADVPPDKAGVVAFAVSGSGSFGELGDRLIEHDDVMRDVVGSRVARAQHAGQQLAGRVGEHEQWVEAIPTLVLCPVPSFPSLWKVRHSVESEATLPNRCSSEHKNSM